MSRNLKFFALILLALLSATACYSQKKFKLSVNESRVAWKGTYVVGGGHEGTLGIVSGTLTRSADSSFTAGNFVLATTAVQVLNMKESDGASDLAKHLMSDDFFSAATFPEAYFGIAKVTSVPGVHTYTVDGFLSIKGVSHRIQFPATIKPLNASSDTLHATAAIKIDRTKWTINHSSKTIFTDLKEGIISDEVLVTLDLVFR